MLFFVLSFRARIHRATRRNGRRGGGMYRLPAARCRSNFPRLTGAHTASRFRSTAASDFGSRKAFGGRK